MQFQGEDTPGDLDLAETGIYMVFISVNTK